MKQLIVNADDFGRAPGVNRGILETHTQGIVTSTTVMINYPDAAPGLEQALTEAPGLGIGLHLNLTSGAPVLPASRVPTLIDEQGRFHHISQWTPRMDRFAGDEMRAEIDAQFDRFRELTGRLPDHLDAHHHATYLHPAAFDHMLALAETHQLPLRQAGITSNTAQTRAALLNMLPDYPTDGLDALIGLLRTALDQHPAPHWPARLETGFFGKHITLGELLLILTDLPDDSLTELLCHPGYVDDTLGSSGYTTPRETELAHLTARATRECVEAEGIQLITFADLATHQDRAS